MRRLAIIYLAILSLLCSCQQQAETPAEKKPAAANVPVTVNRILQTALSAETVELPAQALYHWRQQAETKPQLVLFSQHPFLQPIPAPLTDEALRLTTEGPARELYNRGSLYRSDPAILTSQVLSAALAADLISAVTWVFPFPQPLESLNLEDFRQQAVDAGFFSEAEAQSLKVNNLQLSGKVRGTPLKVVHPDLLPEIDSPIILHVDLSYFRGLFRDGVKTPAYDLLKETALKLRQAGWQTLATTLSYRTEEGEISLDTRFLIDDLQALINQPERLGTEMPATWKLRADAMASRVLAQKQEAYEYYQQANSIAPEVASTHFDLYRIHRLYGDPQQALVHLQEAVKLDKAYAYAFFEPLQESLAAGEFDRAASFHEKIIAAAPENPFFLLQYIELLLNNERHEEARGYLEQLSQLNWSAYYHPQVPNSLKKLSQQATSSKLFPTDDRSVDEELQKK